MPRIGQTSPRWALTLLTLVASLAVGPALGGTAIASAATSPPVTVTLSFDDGLNDQLQVQSMLNAHGMSGVFFINSGRLDTPGYMTTAQVGALAAAGNEIGGHTVTHADLPTLSTDEQRRQVCNDRVALLNDGFQVYDFAYPYGDSSSTTAQVVADCGYNSARDVGGIVSPGTCSGCDYAEHIPPTNPYDVITPDSIKSDMSLATIEDFVLNARAHGGGWVPLVMHHVCDGCDALSISPATLGSFLDWLSTQASNGVNVATMHDVVGGSLQAGVPGPAPTPSGTATNMLNNPSMENVPAGTTTPPCWQHGGYGTNSGVWSVSTDAHNGSVAQRVDVSGFASGDVRLISKWDLGACAPPALAGHTYTATGWYESNATVRMVTYYRTSSGAWTFLSQTGNLPTTSSYAKSTVSTGVLPAGATGLSIGYSVRSNGYLVADDAQLVDADQTPPTVSLSAPNDNSVVRGSVTLTASASDASGIDHVDFLVTGAVVATAHSAPYTAQWDSTSLPDQSVGIAARAYDTAGNLATSDSHMVTIANSVPPDTTPPTVTLTAPTDGSTVSGSVPLTVDAADNDQVNSVEYSVDGVTVAMASAAPWSAAWDSRTHADGAAQITATAVDRSGNRTTTPVANVTVANAASDVTPPSTQASCNGGACATTWYAQAVSVALSATDDLSGVAEIRYTTDGSEPDLTNGSTYAAPLQLSASATVRYRAYDKAGNAETTHDLSLLIDTQAPTGVAITSPAPNATVTGIAPITTVSSDNVGVVRVKFFLDGIMLGSRITQPMQWNWDTSTTTKGTHTIYVAALDAAGNYTKSPPITVTVQ